jgi:uncharacterized membrane protein YdbT with pleckstrin-like domain
MPEIYSRKSTKLSRKEENKESQKVVESSSSPMHTHNPLSAFCYEPHGIRFETQDERERIVLLLRQHPIVNVPWILMAILLAVAPSFLSAFPLLDFLPVNFQFVSILFWYLIVLAFVVESALSWFFNVYIVTDERIVDVDFVNLIYREISEANIDDIQEVNSIMGGVPATVFNYGNVRIQTSSANPTFEFDRVPNPTRVTEVINRLREEEEQETLEGRTR